MHRALFLLLLAAGCGSAAPVDFTGTYTVNVTNGSNVCGFPNWSTGSSSTGIPLTISQNGGMLSAQVGGLTGVYLDLILGSHTLSGTAAGDTFDLTLPGSRAGSQGTCAYTINAHALGTLSGDALSDSLHYTAATNHSPDCAALASCESVQNFNGTRPPPPG